jgi:hypothetical protein
MPVRCPVLDILRARADHTGTEVLTHDVHFAQEGFIIVL